MLRSPDFGRTGPGILVCEDEGVSLKLSDAQFVCPSSVLGLRIRYQYKKTMQFTVRRCEMKPQKW